MPTWNIEFAANQMSILSLFTHMYMTHFFLFKWLNGCIFVIFFNWKRIVLSHYLNRNVKFYTVLDLTVSKINAAISSPLHLAAQSGSGLTSYYFRHGGKKTNSS